MKKIVSFLISSILFFSVLTSNFSSVYATIPINEGFKVPGFTGTFVQPWVYKKWGQTRADLEFKRMKDFGVDTLIMGDTATKDEKWSLEYPSKLHDFQGETNNDDGIKFLLDLCKKYDIKLYLGLGVDNKWWDNSTDLTSAEGRAWFETAMRTSANIAKELYELYKSEYGDIFYGYYSVYEIWNHNSWNTESSRKEYVKTLSKGFNILIEAINKIDPKMPLVFSPFATNKEGLATKENTQKFYSEFFGATNFRKIDAFSPMDNCGGGGQNLDSLEEWTIAYADAVNSSGNKLQFWSNCESFIQPDNLDKGKWTTAPVNRYIKQVEIASKYASKILNFSFPHYMSPYNTITGFDRSYMNYLKTGTADVTNPAPPKKVKTDIIEGTLLVKWSPANDEYDIAQYKISKLNLYSKQFEPYVENVIGREDGSRIDPVLKCSFSDSYYNKKLNNIYVIEAMDCSGNYSDKIYVVVDGLNPINSIDIDSTDGEKGYYTASEYAQLDLTFDSPKEQIKPNDNSNMLYVIAGCVVSIAIISLLLTVTIVSQRKKKHAFEKRVPQSQSDDISNNN